MIVSGEEEAGGVQNVIGNLKRHLQSRGHEVVFFHGSRNTFTNKSLNRAGDTTFDLNLQLPFGKRHVVVGLLLFLIRFPIGLFQLVQTIRKNNIQIVNVHYPGKDAAYFALCRRLLPFGLVTSVHGADLFPGGKPQSKYPRSIKLLLRGSDRITAPSQSFRQDVATQFPFLERRIKGIHNGVNFDEMANPHGDADTDSLGQYLLCIAMHNEKKGLDVLLHAFALVANVAPDLKLALAGDGPLRKDLEGLAATLGISGRVKFLGRKGRPQIAQLIQGCEIFVLPSRSEPFGIVLIEAMACRKPVVATRVGGIPEIVENGKSGILVEPDDPKALAAALLSMLQNHDLRLSIADKGYDAVHKKFSSNAMGAAYEALFQDVYRSAVRKI